MSVPGVPCTGTSTALLPPPPPQHTQGCAGPSDLRKHDDAPMSPMLAPTDGLVFNPDDACEAAWGTEIMKQPLLATAPGPALVSRQQWQQHCNCCRPFSTLGRQLLRPPSPAAAPLHPPAITMKGAMIPPTRAALVLVAQGRAPDEGGEQLTVTAHTRQLSRPRASCVHQSAATAKCRKAFSAAIALSDSNHSRNLLQHPNQQQRWRCAYLV